MPESNDQGNRPASKPKTAKSSTAKPAAAKSAATKPAAKSAATKPAAKPAATETTSAPITPDLAAKAVRSALLKNIRFAGISLLALVGIGVGSFAFATYQRATSQQEDTMMAASEVARDWGLNPLVAVAENIYYGYLNPAKVGGTPAEAAGFDDKPNSPNVPRDVSKVSPTPEANIPEFGPATEPQQLPEPLTSPVKPLPGEGKWRPTKIVVNGATAIYIARIRPDTSHTSIYATVAWFDTHLLGFSQVPGTKLPEGKFDHGNGKVANNLRKFYVAGFANGYKMNQSQGGYVKDGVVVSRLVRGKATLLTYPDGSIDIVKWGRDAYKPGFSVARQNLNLMVDRGASKVLSNSAAEWGSAWHGTGSGGNYVWRSGVGKTADGNIVYVQSAALTAETLADLLVRAGAVEAMALDMNSGFANGNLFGPYLPKGKHINPDNPNPALDFYKTSERDFVAVFAKSPK